MNNKLRKVKTHSDHFVMKMVNISPRFATLALWKAKFSEVGNEFVRYHASFIVALTNVKVILLNQERNPRHLSALGVVIMPACEPRIR